MARWHSERRDRGGGVGGGRKLTDFEMAAMLHGGSTLEEIAKVAGITRERVRQRLARIGVVAAKRVHVVRLLEVVRTRAICSLPSVSRAMGVERHAVARALCELGLRDSVDRLFQWRVRAKRRAELQVAVAALRDYGRRLGRTPGMRDLLPGSRPRGVPCVRTLQASFGSLVAAQRAAGLEPNRWRKRSREN